MARLASDTSVMIAWTWMRLQLMRTECSVPGVRVPPACAVLNEASPHCLLAVFLNPAAQKGPILRHTEEGTQALRFKWLELGCHCTVLFSSGMSPFLEQDDLSCPQQAVRVVEEGLAGGQVFSPMPTCTTQRVHSHCAGGFCSMDAGCVLNG